MSDYVRLVLPPTTEGWKRPSHNRLDLLPATDTDPKMAQETHKLNSQPLPAPGLAWWRLALLPWWGGVVVTHDPPSQSFPLMILNIASDVAAEPPGVARALGHDEGHSHGCPPPPTPTLESWLQVCGKFEVNGSLKGTLELV